MHSNLYQRLKYSDARSFGAASRVVLLFQRCLTAWRNCGGAIRLTFAFSLYALAYALLSGMFFIALALVTGWSGSVVGELATSFLYAGSSLTEIAGSAIASAQTAPSTSIDGMLSDVLLWILLIGVAVVLCASLPVALVSVLAVLSRVLILISTSCLLRRACRLHLRSLDHGVHVVGRPATNCASQVSVVGTTGSQSSQRLTFLG